MSFLSSRLGGFVAGGSELTDTVAIGSSRSVSWISFPEGTSRTLSGFFLSFSLLLAAERKSLRSAARLIFITLVSPPPCAEVTEMFASEPDGWGDDAHPCASPSFPPPFPPSATDALRSFFRALARTFSFFSRSFSARLASFARSLRARSGSTSASPSSAPDSTRFDPTSRVVFPSPPALSPPSLSSRDRRYIRSRSASREPASKPTNRGMPLWRATAGEKVC